MLLNSPTSLSFEKDKTPRLAGDTDISFTSFTTKNISSNTTDHPDVFNVYTNGKLAYKRAPRGSDHEYPTKVKWGPSAFRLTKDNFKTLKKNQLIYMDRDSVHFRGPIIFHQLLRGPKLRVSAKDRGYDNIYFFILDVMDIDKFQLYAVSDTSKQSKKNKKTRKKSIKKKINKKKSIKKKSIRKKSRRNPTRKKSRRKKINKKKN